MPEGILAMTLLRATAAGSLMFPGSRELHEILVAGNSPGCCQTSAEGQKFSGTDGKPTTKRHKTRLTRQRISS